MKKSIIILIFTLSLLPKLNYAQGGSTHYKRDYSNQRFALNKVYADLDYGFLITDKSHDYGAYCNVIFTNNWGISIDGSKVNLPNARNLPSDYASHPKPFAHLFFISGPNDYVNITSIRIVKDFQISRNFSTGIEGGISYISYKEDEFYKIDSLMPTIFSYDYNERQKSTAVGLSLRANVEYQLLDFLGVGFDVKTDINSIHTFVAANLHLTFWFYNRERRAT
ncbi:MAG: hypothetical protein WCL51_03085 [Bacteroidota bacterium]